MKMAKTKIANALELRGNTERRKYYYENPDMDL
jgi:hypothetical protein